MAHPLMPVFFVGHGNPMNAILDNPFTRSLAAMSAGLPDKPKAILVVSAHWLTDGSFACTTPHPRTIYDFFGFPDELYRVRYPAPGAPDLARDVMRLATGTQEEANWGLDHGAWAVLKHLFPAADIPVAQLSIDFLRSARHHFDLGRRLRPLREQGVLVVGSGNIVHNLPLLFSMDAGAAPYDWAVEFDEWVKERIVQRDFNALVRYDLMGETARLAVPTVDHYAPLLYTLGLADPDEEIVFPYEEVFATLSMRCLRVG